MIFKNDDEILINALSRFKSKHGSFLQRVTVTDQGFHLGKVIKFNNQKELSNVVWNIPGSDLYIAVLENETGLRLTYKGKTFTTTYSNITFKPQLEYLKVSGSKYRADIDFNNIDLELEKLDLQIKNAS